MKPYIVLFVNELKSSKVNKIQKSIKQMLRFLIKGKAYEISKAILK